MNLDAVALALIVGLAIAVVEGIKQAFESLSGKELPSGAKVILCVTTGTILASVAEFAPETWVRIVPILTAGLASAGLYSISKRAGGGLASAIQTKRIVGSPEAYTTLVDLSEEFGFDGDDSWADFVTAMEDDKDPDADKPCRPMNDQWPPKEDPDSAGPDGPIEWQDAGTDEEPVPA